MKSFKLINLPKILDKRGNLSFVESETQIPFKIKRVFYIYDVPIGESRGAHSHIKCHQFLIALSGSFYVEIDDGKNKNKIYLNKPNIGLHIPPGIWASEVNFSKGSVCLVLASHNYDENDYIRDYKTFINTK